MKMNFADLLKSGGLIRERAIGWDQVERFLSLARKDLATAQKILPTDAPVSLDLVYKAMFHASNGLLHSFGFRPGKVAQHKAVIRATERILGRKAEVFIFRFDKLRQKRNYFEYGAGFISSKEEIKNSLKEAKKFIDLVGSFLKEKNPQKKLF